MGDKGLDVLRHLLTRLKQSELICRTLLVVGGPMRADCEKLSYQFGLKGQAHFLGARRSEELAAALRQARIGAS